ncbi:MAG: CUAEP/CCAEP-tail radical SAM protein [Acidiferrobacterales bacterium]|nr:CUAEP/CCAEP-tail radical SAM protein [Acidiferrobacterales bacterium]
MKVVLISPYEIGRQPFALAQPAAWLARDGFDVDCIDLSIEPFQAESVNGAQVVAFHLAMHTGARLAAELIPQVVANHSDAALCVYGLYAPVNDEFFRSLGCEFVFGGEAESDILALCRAVRDTGSLSELRETRRSLDKLVFVRPLRSLLPELDQYSYLTCADGTEKTTGFVEASRGCRHLCRHCPVVPVYSGTFRVVSTDVVLEDIRQQIDAGAQHISFGDPDFLNGPGHARRIIDRFQQEYPGMTWDATVKIEHLLRYEDLVGRFSEQNCLFITSAVESVENDVLEKLDKGHTAEDFRSALHLLRRLGISMHPTFVPFTPWTTSGGYLELLRQIVELELINGVAPVQLSIRLLLPRGSSLVDSEDRDEWLGPFNPKMLGYDWRHRDSRVDELQAIVQEWVIGAQDDNLTRMDIFAGIWTAAHQFVEGRVPELMRAAGRSVPQMSEPWYCCAEPTENLRKKTTKPVGPESLDESRLTA